MNIPRRDAILRLCENPYNFDYLSLGLNRSVTLIRITERFARYMVRSAQELLKAADGVAPLTVQMNLQYLSPRQAGAVIHKYPNFHQLPRTEIQLVVDTVI